MQWCSDGGWLGYALFSIQALAGDLTNNKRTLWRTAAQLE